MAFRERFLSHEEITAQVLDWAEKHPELVRAESVARTPEGRDLWLLTIGPEPDRERPGVWVDGNMHAAELCGSSVALAIADDVIRAHLDPDDDQHGLGGLPATARAAIRDVLFYVMPRMSPDGAEAVLSTGHPVRSAPRLRRHNQQHARWVGRDLDGDGEIRLMRIRDPHGELAEHPELPGVLLPRRIEDEGPFYKVFLEGEIENYDGHNIPSPRFLDDNDVDFNRNFPFSWAPTTKQTGAGVYPLSEPETRAVVEQTEARPHLFAWLNLHTFGGVFIRPLGDKPDTKMNPADLALFRQLGTWAEELTGYPMVSGFEEFTYEPDTPLHGDLTDYAFHQLGCIAYVVELWDLFSQVGLERKKRFVENYTHLDRDDLIAIARWDRDNNKGRIFGAWRPFDHPQLGEVELGGVDPRIGLWNPPLERVGEICAAQSAHLLRVAALAPRLELRTSELERDGDVTRGVLEIANSGYLPTHILGSALALEHNEPVHLHIRGEGCELLAPHGERVEIGHLDGWGRGQYSGETAFFYLRTRGTTGRRAVPFAVAGSGTLHVRAGSCRVGFVELEIPISAART